MNNKDKNEFQHIYSVTTHQHHILSFNMAVIAYRDGTRTLFDQVHLHKIVQYEKHKFFGPGAFRKNRGFLQKLTLGRIIPWVSRDPPGHPLVPSLIAYDEFTSSSSLSSVSTFTIILIHGLLGCGNDFADFAHSLAQNLSASHASADWRMVTVDLRNHGRSTDIEGLLPPHDLENTARDIANLAKYLDIWPDVVVGHSLGGKVVLQYALSSAQGDYGDSTQLPKQVWVLDCGPGAYEGGYGTEEALYSLKTTPIPSKEWLADYIINLGFPKSKADWICDSLKKSGEQWLLSFNVDGAIEMYTSARDTDYWPLLEHPPKDMEIAVVRTENWNPDVAERLESLAKRESDESTGKVSVDVVSNSGHWIYRDQPEKLMEIMTPRLVSLAKTNI